MIETIIKKELPDVLAHQLAFFSYMPTYCTPRNIIRIGEQRYSYSYIEGDTVRTAEDISAAYSIMSKVAWVVDGLVSEEEKSAYIEYCVHASKNVGVDLSKSIDTINDYPFERVRMVHGDLTIGNILKSRLAGDIVFIDPSVPRLWAREIDESKLMQFSDCRILPFFPLRIHYALLATHYVRLAKHTERHTYERISAAIDNAIRIERIL